MKIYINKDGYVGSLYITDANIPIEVSKEEAEKILTYPIDYNWRYINKTFVLELLPSHKLYYYQQKRQRECFDIIDNRSPMWYAHLTEVQKQELYNWYQAWLDVTETEVVPEKPAWLK